MNHTSIRSLDEVAESVRYGYTASAVDESIGPHFLRITDIVPYQIDWSRVPYCEIGEENRDRFGLKAGDIVIARTGATTGYAKLIRGNPEAVFASYLVRVRVDPRYANPGYVGRLVESRIYKRFVWSQIGGAAQPNASAKRLAAFRFPVPDFDTQQRIVNSLKPYEDLIENNRRRIQLLDESARLLYREWFVHLRFPGHEHVPVVDGVPEGWEFRPLSDVADLTMGQSPKSDFYNEEGEGLPFHQGVTDFGRRFVEHRIYCSVRNRVAQAGDILCSVRAPVGRLNLTLDSIVVGRGLAAIREKNDRQSHLFYQLRSHFFREDLFGSGAIFAAINKKELANQKLLRPPARLITEFEKYSRPMDRQIEILHKQNEKLAQARDLLLPRLMNGEIAV